MRTLARWGLVVLAVGLLGDVLAHSLPGLAEPFLGPAGFRAHLVTFAGMLLVVAGVLQQGLNLSWKGVLTCRLAVFSTRFRRPSSSSSTWPRS